MNAEALATEYNPDADPILGERPAIRIQVRAKGVPRKPKYRPRELTHDVVYRAVERSKSLSDRVARIEARLRTIDDGDEDAAIAVLAEMLQVMLEGDGDVKDALIRGWNDDTVTIEYLMRTVTWCERVQKARVAAGEASRQS